MRYDQQLQEPDYNLVVGKETVHQVGRQEYTAVAEKEKAEMQPDTGKLAAQQAEFLGDIEVSAGNLSGQQQAGLLGDTEEPAEKLSG